MENKFRIGDNVKFKSEMILLDKDIKRYGKIISFSPNSFYLDILFMDGVIELVPCFYLEFDLDKYNLPINCTCGAKYTSFSKHHLNWCDSLGNKNDTNK